MLAGRTHEHLPLDHFLITIDIKLLHPPKHLAQSQTAPVVRMKLIYGKVTVKINGSSNKSDVPRPAAVVICCLLSIMWRCVAQSTETPEHIYKQSQAREEDHKV